MCAIQRIRSTTVNRSSGSATVEFAVLLPLLVLLFFGSIEACNLSYLKQALAEAAQQGCLVAMKPQSSEAQVIQRINDVLSARSITVNNIDVADGQYDNLNPGDTFTITISMSTSENQNGPSVITLGSIQSTVCSMKQ